MMEQKNVKGKNIIIIILSILLIISLAYIGYDKIFKKVKSNENISSNEPSQHQDNINSFEIFKKNIKKGIAKCNLGVYSTETGTSTSLAGDYNYRVILTNEMKLIINFEDKELNKKYGNYKITEGVLGFHLALSGTAGENKLYFINEDGTLGYASIDSLINNGKLDIIKKMDGYKNIVSIIQGSHDSKGRTNEPLFIDINGNVFENTYTAWGQ